MEHRDRVLTRNFITLILTVFIATGVWIFNKLKIRLRGKRALYVAIDLLIGFSPYYLPFINNINTPIIGNLLTIIIYFFFILGILRISALLSLITLGMVIFQSISSLTSIVFIIDLCLILFLLIGGAFIKKFIRTNNKYILLLIDHINNYRDDILCQFWIYRIFDPRFHK